MVPSGLVKSMRNCALDNTCATSEEIMTPVFLPKNAPASSPSCGHEACSKAPTSVASVELSTASINIFPIRPVAPAIAIFIICFFVSYSLNIAEETKFSNNTKYSKYFYLASLAGTSFNAPGPKG